MSKLSRLVPLYVLEKMVMEIPDTGKRAAVFVELKSLLNDGYGFIQYKQLPTLGKTARSLLLPYMAGRTNLIALCTEAVYVES